MPGSKFGTMYASSELYPATCKPEDVFRRLQAIRETLYTQDGDDKILRKGTLDFISFSYYRSNIISTETTNFNVLGGDLNPYLQKSD